METREGFGRISILIGVVVVLAIGAGGFYIVTNTGIAPKDTAQEESESKNNEITTNSEVSEKSLEKDLAELSPKEIYIKMKEEVDDAESLDEVIDAMLKYTTEEKRKEVELSRQEAQSNPLGEQFIFLLFKTALPSADDIIDIREEIIGNTATLYPSTSDVDNKGIVILKKENNVWKIEKEDWQKNISKEIRVNIEL